MMMNKISNAILRSSNKSMLNRFSCQQIAKFGTAEKSGSVMDAWNKSCYHEMDFTISDEEMVFDAVKKFSAFDVGALVTTNEAGKFLLHSASVNLSRSISSHYGVSSLSCSKAT